MPLPPPAWMLVSVEPPVAERALFAEAPHPEINETSNRSLTIADKAYILSSDARTGADSASLFGTPRIAGNSA
jgi:hypothetical protein